jgi:hypothetical protein
MYVPNANERDLYKIVHGVRSVAMALQLGNLVNAANDTAAAAAGVSVGELYRNGNVLMIRVS